MAELVSWVSGSRHRTIESNLRQCWQDLKRKKVSLNERQKKVLNKLFSGFKGKLTREKWMKITKASSRTALRDIEKLIAVGVIERLQNRSDLCHRRICLHRSRLPFSQDQHRSRVLARAECH